MASAIPAGFHALPLPIAQLSLAAVLKCGQSFRWSILPLTPPADPSSTQESVPSHEYRFCLRDRVVCLRQSSENLYYRSVFPETPLSTQEALKDLETLTWLRDYFQLDVDLTKLYEEWSSRDPVFNGIQSRFSGIRMLRQDPWENLVSFICSSNNNISRIGKMVTSLCKYYSQPLLSLPHPSPSSGNIETYYPFPAPSVLAAPEVSAVLRNLGFGYRAEFIQRTANMLLASHGRGRGQDPREPSEQWLMTLRDVSTSDAREELLKFVGVGRKVADCILLMSLDKREVIPVDTHVHQIAIKHYGLRGSSGAKANMTPKLYEEVNAKLAKVWGYHAGWAHSVLFTADLKSFSSYGLPSSPASSPSPMKKDLGIFPTPPVTPLPKRKRSTRIKTEVSEITVEVLPTLTCKTAETIDEPLPLDLPTSLAERVKKRRRVFRI